MTDAERGELRELLFDGVAPPADTDLMFERTFAATGDDGAHLLPPDDLFDAGDPADELPLDDLAPDADPLLDDGLDGYPPGADSSADWSDGSSDADPVVGDPVGDPALDDPALSDPALSDPALGEHVGGDAPDVPFDHPTSGW